MKDSGALPDDLCLNYVRLDFANNNDNTSFGRHLSHEKIIVMMMMVDDDDDVDDDGDNDKVIMMATKVKKKTA